MCNLPDEEEGREESGGNHEQDLEMAYHMVPGMEGLSKGTRKRQSVKIAGRIRE
jgi:hypothetical protein